MLLNCSSKAYSFLVMLSKLKNRLNNNVIDKSLLYVTFGVYLFILFWAIALKFNAEWLPELGRYFRSSPLWDRVGWGIVPFVNIFRYLDKDPLNYLDFVMNFVVYAPLGIYLMLILRNKRKKLLAIAIIVLSSITFETVQLITGFGGCDGTDFAMNSLGGVFGMVLFNRLSPRTSNKTINWINFGALVVFSPLAIYGLVNTLLNLHLYKIY